MENYGKDEVISEGKDEEERRENDGDENDGDEEVIKSTSGSPGDDRPFILPKEWTINDFLPTMSNKVFKTLCAQFQTTSQSVSLESLRNVIQGRPQTLACMTLCSRHD